MRRPSRLALRLSGVRVVGSTGQQERSETGMAAVLKEHLLLVFQAAEDQIEELRAEVAKWTRRWGFSGLVLPSEDEVAEVIRRGQRIGPGPDCLPYAMWRNAGGAGARTVCKMLRAFGDGTLAPPRFDEAWLAVLPKGRTPTDSGSHCERPAENIRPLLKNTDRKNVVASLARGMQPILRREVHPTQRGLVAGRDLRRNVVELDT